MAYTATLVDELAPLAHLNERDIEKQLLGYPEATVTAAKELRSPSPAEEIEGFLLALLSFFVPAGGDSKPVQARSDLLLRDELGLDSLALAEAMFKIEDLFGIRVENEELAELRTLADARTLLTGKLSSQA